MFFRVRRTSDSVTYTCVWWFAFVTCNIGLAIYAYVKIEDLLSRAFFLQTTERAIPRNNTIMPFPDIMMCSTHTVINETSKFVDVDNTQIHISNITLTESSLPNYRKLCREHTALNIFSMLGKNVDVTQDVDGKFGIRIAAEEGENKDRFTRFYLSPSYNNPVMSNGTISNDTWNDILYNWYAIPQEGNNLNVRIINVKTTVLKEGLLGYFGQTEDVPKLTVSTEGSTYYRTGHSRAVIYFPKKEIEQKQILFTTVQSAFGDWGGAFSVIWGVFYVLLGSPRLDPFGVVATLLMTKKVKDKIRKTYGPLPQEAPHSNMPEVAPTKSRSFTSSTETPVNHPTSLTGSPAFEPSPLISSKVESSRPEEHQQHRSLERHMTQRMLEDRVKRLEQMLGEFYLKMPEDTEDEEGEEKNKDNEGSSKTWRQIIPFLRYKLSSLGPSLGRRSSPGVGKSTSGRYKQAVDSQDAFHDQVPLRPFGTTGASSEPPQNPDRQVDITNSVF